MLLNIIDEVNKALDNDMYISALALVLTIPDICAKAEYPLEKTNKKRYVDWFDNHIGHYEQPPEKGIDDKCPHLSGEVIYTLRNSILHQGTPNIDKDKIKNEDNKIDRFVLVKEPKKEIQNYSDFSSCSETGWMLRGDKINKMYHLNIRRLCFLITSAAEYYYEENKEKFDFFNYTMVDKGHEFDDLFNI